MTDHLALYRKVCVGLLTAVALASCQLAPPSSGAVVQAAPSFRLDTQALVNELALKQARNWQDTMLTYPPLLARMKDKQGQQAKNFSLQATSGSQDWNYDLGSATTVVPTFAHAELYYDGPSALAGDRLYTMSNAGVMRKFPATFSGAPAPLLTSAALGSYDRTALVLSGDNRRIYTLTTDGYIRIIDPTTLTVIANKRLSTSGFRGTAPYVDYGNMPSGGNSNFGSIENVICVSRDGSVFRVRVSQPDTAAPTFYVAAYTVTGSADAGLAAATWDTRSNVSYGSAPTVDGFPVAWNNRIFFGSTAGVLYDLDISGSPVTRSYNLAQYTSATSNGRSITAPAAFDFDASFALDKVFVGCGDRLVWVNPQTGEVTPSASLTLDRKPASNYGALSSVGAGTPTVLTYNTPSDFASVKTSLVPAPNIWGKAGTTAVGTGLAAISVRLAANGDAWITDYASDRVRVYRTNGSVQDVAVSNQPIKLEFDNVNGTGFLWVAGDGIGSSTNGWVTKIDPATATVVSGFPKSVPSAVWLAPDGTGNCYVSSHDTKRAHKLNAAGASVGGNWPVSVVGGGQGPGTIFTDPVTKNLWAFPYGSNRINILKPDGTLLTPQITVSASANALPFGVVFQATGSPRLAYVSLNNTNEIVKMNADTGAILSRVTTQTTRPATLRYDNAGNLWSTNVEIFGSTPRLTQMVDPETGLNTGSSYNLSAYGNPFEIVFDATDTAFVACSTSSFNAGALVNISNLGNLADIFATSYRVTPGDGDESFGYTKFKVPVNAFSNRVPISAKLTMTAAASALDENIETFGTSPYSPAGPAWKGYPGAPNIAVGNRPLPDPLAWATVPGLDIALNAAYAFDVPPPVDQNNAGDASNSHASYAVRSTNRQLRDALHWYSNTSAGTTTSRYPKLAVTLANGVTLPTTHGIRMQPAIDADAKKVYVGGSNALFELSYADVTSWRSPTATTFTLTTRGRAGTTTTTPGGGNYIWPLGNTLITSDGRVVVPDVDPTSATGVLMLNSFNLNLTGDRHHMQLDLNPGRGLLTSQILYDYAGGHVYAITNNNKLIRAKILD